MGVGHEPAHDPKGPVVFRTSPSGELSDRVDSGLPFKETMLVFAKRQDPRSPMEQALDAASGLKAGSWASVEALAMLAVEAKAHARPEAETLYAAAQNAAQGLKPGSWESVRALTWLARAGRDQPGQSA